MSAKGTLMFRAINVNDSGHQEQVRQPLRLPREPGRRHQARHDVMIAGKIAVVARLRRRRQGLGAGAARALGPGLGDEIDPINALQARWKATVS